MSRFDPTPNLYNSTDYPRPEVEDFVCSLSGAFYNKQMRTDDLRVYVTSFHPYRVTIEQLYLHIVAGNAWSPGVYDGGRGKANFVSAQTLALDLDNNISSFAIPFDDLAGHYGAIAHPSPSSTEDHEKTRVIFVLSEPITDMAQWELLQRGLIRRFSHLEPDQSCKDAARLYYGSTVTGGYVNYAATVPTEIAQAWAEPIIRQEQLEARQRELKPRPVIALDHANKYVEAALRAELDQLQFASERHTQLWKSSCAIMGMVKGRWPGVDESRARVEIQRITETWCRNENDRAEVVRIMNDAYRAADSRELRTG